MKKFLIRPRFSKSDGNPKLYIKVENNKTVIILLYVDDLFVISVQHLIIKLKRELAYEFNMKDIDVMHHYLGVKVWKMSSDIFLGQVKYIINILKKFRMMK